MIYESIYRVFIPIILTALLITASCSREPLSDSPVDSTFYYVEFEVTIVIGRKVAASPLIGIDGSVYRESPDKYTFLKKTAESLEPPSGLHLSDSPDDNGHYLILTWTLSPSEQDTLVAWYRIYRSQNQTPTTPRLLSEFASFDSLNSWEEHSTVLIDSVKAGTSFYNDTVPLNGVLYYYWIQAVGYSGELPSDLYSVTGTVKDQSGQPVEGALLRLYNADETFDQYVISDSDGTYLFENVPSGEYYLVAKRDDYTIFSTSVTVP